MTQQPTSTRELDGAAIVPESLDLPTPAEFYTADTESSSRGGGEPPEPSVPFIEYESLPKKLPDWYAPGYFTEANRRERWAGLSDAGYGVPQGPDYNNNTLAKYNRNMLERRIEQGTLSPGEVTMRLERLSEQYPLASPDMLLGYAMTGAPVDTSVVTADQQAYADLLAEQNPLPAGNSLVTAKDGYIYDRTEQGVVTLNSGQQVEVEPGDVVVRDLYGQAVGVQPKDNNEEEWNFGPLNWLKTAAKGFFYTLSLPYEGLIGTMRNVGASLGEGEYGEAALDVLGYIPLVAGVREMVEGDAYINPWEQTYMGQMILAAARGERIDVGTGWFINENSDIFNRQLEAVTGAYSVDGNAWTLGRGIAGAVELDPNSTSYKIASGFVDFSSAVLLDPTVWAAGLGIPSKAARALTTPGRLLGTGTAGATTVRAARKAVGREPGTGTLEFGIAKRQAAKLDARKLRVAAELPKQRQIIESAQQRLSEANLSKEKIAEENKRIADAQARVAALESEALDLFREGEALRLIGNLEDAAEGKVRAFTEQQDLATRNRLAGRKPYLAALATQRREAQARLTALEEVETLGERLQTITGRGQPTVGGTVRRGKVDWTVTAVSDDRITIVSPRGARRNLTPEEFAEQYPTAAPELPLHTREQIRTALMNMQARNAPEQTRYEVDGLSSLNDLPGDVTVTAPRPSTVDDPDMRVGNLDGEGMVAAWTGDAEPVLVHAADNVPESVVDRLTDRLAEKVGQLDQAEQRRLRDLARKVGPDSEEYQEALVEAWVKSETLSDDLTRLLAASPVEGRALPEPEARPQPETVVDEARPVAEGREEFAEGWPRSDIQVGDTVRIGREGKTDWEVINTYEDGRLSLASRKTGRTRTVSKSEARRRLSEGERPGYSVSTAADVREVRIDDVPLEQGLPVSFPTQRRLEGTLEDGRQFVITQERDGGDWVWRVRGAEALDDSAKDVYTTARGALRAMESAGYRASRGRQARTFTPEPEATPGSRFSLESTPITPIAAATPTWGQLLDALNENGLAAYLERILREDGYDGISGLLSRNPLDDDGIWWGYNQNIASYKARVGALADSRELRLASSPVSDLDDLALVLADTEGVAAEVAKLQGRVADLEAAKAKALDKADRADILDEARLDEIPREVARYDRMIEQAKQRWAVLAPKLQPIPNYTRAAREERMEAIRTVLRRRLAERERLLDTSRKEAKTFEQVNKRISKAVENLSRQEQIMEGYRMVAGADLDDWGRGAVNFDSAERFIFGGAVEGAVPEAGQYALRVLARETNPAKLHAMAKDKWPDELVEEIIQFNRLSDDDVARLFPQSVRDPDIDRRIAEGEITQIQAVGMQKELVGEAREKAIREFREREVARILASNVGTRIRTKVGSKGVAAVAGNEADPHPGPSRYVVKAKRNAWANRQLSIVPSAVKIDLSRRKDTYQGLKKYLDMARVPEDEQWALLGKLWDSTENGVAANARNVVVEGMNMMRDRLVQRVTDEMNLPKGQADELERQISDATRVWTSGEEDATYYWRKAFGDLDAPIKIKMSDGTSMPMTGAQLESELANGALFLPDPEDFRKVVRRAAPLLGKAARKKDQYQVLGGAADAVNRLFSDYWRSFMLFRPAYVVRNIMEMQVRNFLSGGLNIVNNPLATAAMVFGPALGKKGAMKVFGQTIEPYANDVFGYRFGSGFKQVVDTDEQVVAIEKLHEEYLEILRTDRALVDLRMYTGRGAKRRGAPKMHGTKSRNFINGWAEELLLLRGSPMARIVAGNLPENLKRAIAENPERRQEIITQYIFSSEDVAPKMARDMLGDAGPKYQAMLSDQGALSDYLFGTRGNVDNVQARLDDMTGGNKELRDYVATGDLNKPGGDPVTFKGKLVTSMPQRRDEAHDMLRAILRDNFRDADEVQIPSYVRVWTPDNESDTRNAVDKVLDTFFKASTRIERVGVMGPEWRYVYWETIRDLAPDLNRDAAEALYRNFERTGLTLRSNGSPIGRMRQAGKVIKDAQGTGTLTLTDAHRIAADAASDEVKRLYYDAHKRRQFWHSTRLLVPFGQAWADTIATWARLSAQNPVQLYKAMRGFNAAMEQGSNVIYEASEWALPTQNTGWFESPEGEKDAANWYDPNQGFMYRDPRSGSYMANIPMLGHIGTMLANLPGPLGGSADLGAGQMESAFRIENLNLAFGGGSALPGLGPALTVPLSPLLDSAQGTVPGEFLYDWMYPVGEPDLSRSIFDQILPVFARRLQSAIFDPNSPFVMSNMKASVNFLAAEGNYDMFNQADRQRLMDDAMAMSKRMAVVTAVGQAILPTVPTSVWIGENPDNDRIGLAAASALYYEGYRAMYDDADQAQLAFANDYGPQYLASIVGVTKGDRIIGEEAFNLIKDNLEIGRSYPEELAFLFPLRGNDFSSFAWQEDELRRSRLNPREFVDEFWGYTARMYKARAARNAIVSNLPEDAYKADVQYINDQIARAGGVPFEFRQGADIIESTNVMLSKAPDAIIETENAQAFFQMYSWRQELKNKARQVNDEGSDSLGTKKMKPYTIAYLNALATVERSRPKLRQMVAEFRREVA